MTQFFSEYLGLVVDFVLVKWYGWVLFLWLLIWIYYKLQIIKNQKIWIDKVKWVFLQVKIEELNEKSPLAMEQVFAALHAIHTNYTWGEKLDGKVILWLSCEIVSIGGKVSYVFKIPERYRNLLESAIFAQYPKAEVHEIEDYLKNLPHLYDPRTADFDFFGTQLNKKKENPYPVRTYTAFEHPEQKTVIDPLSGVLEVMSNLQPYELMISQLVIRPVDDKWKEHAKPLIDKLKGAPEKHESSFFDWILAIPGFFLGLFVEGFLTGPSEDKHKPQQKQDEPPSQMLHKTEGEKQIIAAIEHGLTKIGFEFRFRLFYLAPKGKLNKSLRVPEIIGAYRNFDDVSTNGLKPDLGHTWTDVPYKVHAQLEEPIIRHRILVRKRHMLHNLLMRSYWRGSGYGIMNTEELATLYHFPQSPNARVSQIERTQMVKSAPPADLPIG
ncbi:MAG TPA: hypothetical protein VGQ87_01095 [Patescibacteria group bacterium]|jgi:hypothetical protein|nr:hypothetical protein [Patescibacteria group bacterium]